MKAIVIIVMTGLISQVVLSQKNTEMDLKAQFDKYGIEGCFVLYNQSDNEFVRYNQALCDSGYLPASTFKIPNTLIALEEGIIKDTLQIIKWDGHKWPNKLWNQDQNLKTAIKYSCIWVYFGFAEQIGIDKYYSYLKSFDYGNKNLAGPPTRFWLAGRLRISANQQVDFLKRFYNYELPVSKRSVDIVRDLIVLEKKDTYKLSGKTGGVMINDNDYIMWLAGYLEKDNKTYFYAMNFKTTDFTRLSQARLEITKDILRELKLIE